MWRVRHNKVTVTVTFIGELCNCKRCGFLVGEGSWGLTIKYGDGTGRETGKGW